MFTIAIPKGRLQKPTEEFLRSMGVPCPTSWERKLIQIIGKYRFILSRSADVPTLVASGVAQAGVAGTELIEEKEDQVIRVRKLGFGVCRLVLAGPKDIKSKPWRLATSYPNLTRKLLGSEHEIVVLKGSVELAPSIGLSDAIVDLTETGNTLKANGLRIIKSLMTSQAELIFNPADLSFRREEHDQLVEAR